MINRWHGRLARDSRRKPLFRGTGYQPVKNHPNPNTSRYRGNTTSHVNLSLTVLAPPSINRSLNPTSSLNRHNEDANT